MFVSYTVDWVEVEFEKMKKKEYVRLIEVGMSVIP